MKRALSILLLSFLIFGIILNATFVLADDDGDDSGDDNGGDDSGNSNSGNSDNENSENDNGDDSKSDSDSKDKSSDSEKSGSSEDKSKDGVSDDSSGRDDDKKSEEKIESETETKNGETKSKQKTTSLDESGNKIVVETETKTWEDGKSETTVKRKITTPDGKEITFKTKTEIEEGKEKTTNSIEVEGTEVTTKIKVREESKEGIPRLKAELSTGEEQEIIVFPDEALETALNELQTTEGFIFEIDEFVDGETRKAVFSAKAKKPGKLIGIFNTQIDLETLIDTETGEVIQTKRPWWTFLVKEENKADVCHIPLENPNNRQSISVGIPAVKAHLAHGDTIGMCTSICGDGILVEGEETCETGDTQACTTTNGYVGTEECNAACNGFNECVTTESCGDEIINGSEQCDDGNALDGDGCSALCQTEVSEPNPTGPICGNSILEEGETCDDGNAIDGDGCSTLCQIETTL